MTRPFVLPLSHCTDLELVGGKALGLARLSAAGFPVPPGICVTTEAYDEHLRISGFAPREEWRRACALSGQDRTAALADCRSRIRQVDSSNLSAQWLAALQALAVPLDTRWAIRSSATNEDAGRVSFAGLYRTHLGVSVPQIDAAIRDLWASLWEERVLLYTIEQRGSQSVPAMAVVIQPMLDALVSGVAYSIHPVTGRSFHVAVDAVPGLAAPLVDGHVAPDHYIVEMDADQQPARIRRRIIVAKSRRVTVTEEGLRHETIPEAARLQSSLSDEQLFTLGRTAKKIEQALGHPVDLEWAIDSRMLWTLQARPITGVHPSAELTDDDCEWSRANFKETMPEIPSPLGLSFLRHFMEAYLLPHYQHLGCRIPSGLSSVRVLEGRPYLNTTLFYSLSGQLRANPALNSEQMGGEPLRSPPPVTHMGLLVFVRAGWLMWREMKRCEIEGPIWFAGMKKEAERCRADRIRGLSFDELVRQIKDLSRWPTDRDVTFGIVGGIGQCLQVFNRLLPRWLGEDWRSLLNTALQGQSTVISAQQIVRIVELAHVARREPLATRWFFADPWNPADFRKQLAGTAFLQAFDRYLDDYGHRAVGESDIMSPRLAEQPESILALLRTQVSSPNTEAPSGVLARQERGRKEALAEIIRRLRWRWDRQVIFFWWYRRLVRFSSLREANRHHLMYYSTATRNLLQRLGELLAADGWLNTAEDIFFVTMEELEQLLAKEQRDWKSLVAARRAERARQATIQVPNTVRDWEEASYSGSTTLHQHGILRGTSISAGRVTGPARLVGSPADWGKVQVGDIIVSPVIDPGMAPLFGVAGGLIVEMGGTLSHGAIIAREYGLPTVANVEGAMTLPEGRSVELDAGAGTIRLERGS